MRKTNAFGHILGNQDGTVLVTMVVVLIAITALGLTMKTLGDSEIEMMTGDKLTEDSFYDADACNVATARFIRVLGHLNDNYGVSAIAAEDPKFAPGVKYPEDITAAQLGYDLFYKPELPPYLETVDGEDEPQFVFKEDLGFVPERLSAVADIRPRGAHALAGGASNQQNAGYSAGIGLGGAGSGGDANFYIIACEGRALGAGTVNASSRTFVMYRRLLGNVSGGI